MWYCRSSYFPNPPREVVAGDNCLEVVSEDCVGPYQSVVIIAEDPVAVAEWINNNGYNLGDLGDALLAPYVNSEYYA